MKDDRENWFVYYMAHGLDGALVGFHRERFVRYRLVLPLFLDQFCHDSIIKQCSEQAQIRETQKS